MNILIVLISVHAYPDKVSIPCSRTEENPLRLESAVINVLFSCLCDMVRLFDTKPGELVLLYQTV